MADNHSQIFLSYASDDRELARTLSARLEQAGWTVWWDREIVAGDRFEYAIEHAIDHAICVVVIWTTASVASDWVRAEAMEGMDRKCLLPVVMQATKVPLGFRGLNSVNLIGWPTRHHEDEFARLIQRIDQLVGERSEPATPPAEPQPSIDEGTDHRPSIAVLPLITTTEEAAHQVLLAGVTSEVISSLSHVPNFFVISFATSWNYRNRDVNVRQVGLELGVRYIVQGSLLTYGGQSNVVVELVEAATGHQLWSDTFMVSHDLDDILETQHAISAAIAGRLQPRLLVTETVRVSKKPTEELEAWELVNRARPMYLTQNRDEDPTALLRRAIEIDPSYIEAHALLSIYLSFMPETRTPEQVNEARQEVERALELDPNNDQALLAAGLTYVQLAQWEKALMFCKRSVEANPNLAVGWVNYGLAVLGVEKDAQQALQLIDRAFELSPQDDQKYVWYHFKAACFAELQDYEKASENTHLSVNHFGGFWFTWLCHCQYLAASGDKVEATMAWEKAKQLFPPLNYDIYLQTTIVSPLSEVVNDTLRAAVGRIAGAENTE